MRKNQMPLRLKRPAHCPIVDEEAVRELPPVLGAVVRALGWRRAVDFLRVYGGTVLYLPMRPQPWRSLQSEELECMLYFLQDHIHHDIRRLVEMPKVDKILIRRRNKAIHEARSSRHTSERDLARRYGLTQRWIRQIKRDLDAHPPKIADLFE